MKKNKDNIIAICYDYDKTLAPKGSSFDYGFFEKLGITAHEFWQEVDSLRTLNCLDDVLSYMYFAVLKAKQLGVSITKEDYANFAKNAVYYKGVETWFARINRYAKKKGLVVEHYIISSGLKEFIENTSIAKNFKKIYASTYIYDKNGEPVWPAFAINYTNKTQYLYRIKKDVLEENDKNINDKFINHNSRIPFKNMIYIGDSETDIPCMSIVVKNGGTSIGVYEDLPIKKELMLKLFENNRINNYCYADFSENSELEKTVFKTIDKINQSNKTIENTLEKV
ncbi:MAG: HAD family hydrolase [Christensenellales bacterium]